MIEYDKEMPSKDQITEALRDLALDLDRFINQPICQFCAGLKNPIDAKEGQFICNCKVTRVHEKLVVAKREKYEHKWQNPFDDEPPPYIKVIHAPRVLIELAWIPVPDIWRPESMWNTRLMPKVVVDFRYW
jgi:hypothetical protein